MTQADQIHEANRLRNRHVRKLLTHLGGNIDEDTERAIKSAFSRFERDVVTNIIKGAYVHVYENSDLDAVMTGHGD